ncbi:tetratricopeptide repeat protein [Halomonas caseinilytica]|uniref:Tfp pilus assembly protein PilF n=1 Tax=Halomonas caseinilytica TaxID=438744 RepID=A0A1M6Y2G9_9GAMM|nr:tetratricopeptide repeat protein [Halomonas caseinilytica]SHL12430.1 Tfp pilus assembly protein PilF [Halomonas caseinilytica]
MSRALLKSRAHRHPIAILGLAMMLGSCQTLSSDASPDDPFASAPPITRGLDARGLSTLLEAELAGQRGDYRRASRGYLESAERYGAADLAERAALAARFDENSDLLEHAAQRWQHLAPDDTAPVRLLASLAAQRGDWDTALARHLDLIERNGADELVPFLESALESGAPPASLLARLRDFSPTPSSRHDVELATALLEAANGLTASAQDRLARLADEMPGLPGLWRIRAAVSLDTGAPRQAETMARRGLEHTPGDPRLILLLAQAEIRQGNTQAAEANTDALLEDHGDSPDLRLALAQLYLEEGHTGPARRLLLPLTDNETPSSTAYLMLGAIAEQEGEIDNALLYYRQVPEGENFLAARANAARMLFEHDRPSDARTFLRIERLRHPDDAPGLYSLEVELLDESGARQQADALLNQAVEAHPESHQLRYQRAMRAFRHGDIAAMERDLRILIEQDSENANALNALGYTLADENIDGRLDEARRLIERAHAIAPDNPAILDSMGWVRYRQGNPEAALPWLERAWASMPDQEVAAHLIEVLWQLGHHDRARELLQQAHQRFASHPRIDALLDRLPELAQ